MGVGIVYMASQVFSGVYNQLEVLAIEIYTTNTLCVSIMPYANSLQRTLSAMLLSSFGLVLQIEVF